MKLRHIEIFLALARTPNMREVSSRLFLSQAGVSSALRLFENELGVLLFDRVGREIRLNEKGRLLFTYLAPLYRQIDDSIDMIMSGAMVGNVKLGASATLADYVLPQVLYDFKTRHDRVNISLESGSTKEIVKQVEAGTLDMGFVEGDVTSTGVRTASLCKDNLVVISSDIKLAENGPYPIAKLAEKNWLIRQEGSGTRELFLQNVMQKGVSPKIFLEFSNNEAIKTVLHNPGTLTCISPRVVESELRRNEFYTVPISDVQFSRFFLQVLHKRRNLSPLLQGISEAVMERLANSFAKETATRNTPASR
ncbi:LysR substrate-binding domain-containing protein [Maridesulfovibrio sp.]|uniref:LysR substrate-binding domain-containing protein n=1 Tax=Maridesulfovibrio sp. TaxID=2795000 RepID=UPI0029F4C85D|nr:LysR substrate-binding domain-containing protein [Maridesulfovibrio sp.]